MSIEPKSLIPQIVPKKWGSELVLCNNDEFCGKILHFNKGAKFSCHFHVKKREVFWVKSGHLRLMTIDLDNASQTTRDIVEGDIIEIPRMLPHQITAVEESQIIEFSTTHFDSDSYRVIPGDSQQ